MSCMSRKRFQKSDSEPVGSAAGVSHVGGRRREHGISGSIMQKYIKHTCKNFLHKPPCRLMLIHMPLHLLPQDQRRTEIFCEFGTPLRGERANIGGRNQRPFSCRRFRKRPVGSWGAGGAFAFQPKNAAEPSLEPSSRRLLSPLGMSGVGGGISADSCQKSESIHKTYMEYRLYNPQKH